jgi:hypothetical protein
MRFVLIPLVIMVLVVFAAILLAMPPDGARDLVVGGN